MTWRPPPLGARHGHMTLTWLPDRGRHGTRTWVLSTHDGGTIRRIRLSPGEIGCLAGILQTIANEGGRDGEPVG